MRNVSRTALRSDALGAVISPSVSCAGRDVELVICVPVRRGSSDRREAIRLTWGSYGERGGRSTGVVKKNTAVNTPGVSLARSAGGDLGEIILVFFLGSAPFPYGDGEQEIIDEEAKIYGDIFQESYIDVYENLTLKSISVMKWVSKKCPNARYVAKIDDDMYVNIPLLLGALRNQSKTMTRRISSPQGTVASSSNITEYSVTSPPFMIGNKIQGAQVIRDKTSKWYTSEEAYPGKSYPDYLSGTAYAMTGLAASNVYQASLRLPLFWMEDIFITGLCAKLGKVSLVGDFRFTYTKSKRPDGCSVRHQISVHKLTISQMKAVHDQLQNPALSCA